jgi:hypothetical protein
MVTYLTTIVTNICQKKIEVIIQGYIKHSTTDKLKLLFFDIIPNAKNDQIFNNLFLEMLSMM